ncbi:cyun89 [Cyclophragma undans nucleopolyhedrovirus]|uniref:Cyun89 n=1 Tax=Cyclophragma undans nucleopolyhedrovirus TaxID=1906244 RepID=A0A288QPU8_9ABAC|nr:cyun89 [Cyclophragma undans nucleopolyhedrovirus]AOT85547.1 cyun89 [Cyclophragma undans nucleopolyhedrovirus]
MYVKFMTYLHLNGLHGEAKYYKYLIRQLDFENQVADEIRRFCAVHLKPATILDNSEYTLSCDALKKVVKSVQCNAHLATNPYTKEVRFALEYFFDADEICKRDRTTFKKFIRDRYDKRDEANEFFAINNYIIADYEYEDMFIIVLNDYNELINLLAEYNV